MDMELDRHELERLLEIAALGEWLLNGHRPQGERAPAYEGVLQKLYETAEAEGLGYLIETDEKADALKPSQALMARFDAEGLIQDYDDCVFWDELAIRLAERDLREELGARAYDALPAAERHDRTEAAAEAYDREFDAKGIERLRLDRPRRARRTRDALTERLKKLFDDGK